MTIDITAGSMDAERIADPRSRGNAEHVCKGKPGEHLPDGLASELVRNELRRDNRADAVKRPLRQARDDAADEKQRVMRRNCADHVTRDEQRHQAEKDFALFKPGEPQRQDRAADHNGERVCRDQIACLTLGNPERTGDLRQHTGNNKFRGADGKGGKCKYPYLKRHFRLE